MIREVVLIPREISYPVASIISAGVLSQYKEVVVGFVKDTDKLYCDRVKIIEYFF